jgi:hypothetical protein
MLLYLALGVFSFLIDFFDILGARALYNYCLVFEATGATMLYSSGVCERVSVSSFTVFDGWPVLCCPPKS